MNLNKLMKSFGQTISSHKARICLGIGLAGVVVTPILAVMATPKAIDILDGRKVVLRKKTKEDKTVSIVEATRKAWKCYIYAGLSCSASIFFLVKSSSLNTKEIAALAAAYQISTTDLLEYRKKVKETIGEKKEHDIVHDIAQDKVNFDPPIENGIFNTNLGTSLFLEPISGRYFRSNIENVRQAEVTINNRLNNEDYISLNDFNGELKLQDNGVGNLLGWNINDGLPFDKDLSFLSCNAPNGEACTVIWYQNDPIHGYYDYMR